MTLNPWRDIVHYDPEDFDCPGYPGSGELIDLEVVKIADEISNLLGRKVEITGGVRPEEYLLSKGWTVNSAHRPKDYLDGRSTAVDLAISLSSERMKAVEFLIQKKVRRIGVYDRHIHYDKDPKLPQGVFWVGRSAS